MAGAGATYRSGATDGKSPFLFQMHPQNVNWPIEAARRLAYSFGLRGLSRDVQFVFDNHTLDTDRRQLRCNSDSIAVQPQVFDLLVYLVQNRDRVVSKNDLIASVWGGRMVSESALTSRINAARKAVGDSGKDQRIIRTSARKGLRFVGAVQVLPAGDEIAPVVKQPPDEKQKETPLALPLPERPAIVVLPFINMSGDPEQEYFSDGISGDIITALSKLRWFFVIARSSSFTYKGKAVHLRQVAEELGVGYVLEGSVRKSGDRVRITAQLNDVSTGSHIWAERYDRDIADVFAVQDEIIDSIVAAIEPQLYAAENFRARRKPPGSLDAWDLVMRALSHYWRVTRQDNVVAQALLEKAIAMDPNYGQALLRRDVCFSNRPFGVKRFQTIHHHSVDVAHGLVLLFGIGTKALPVWDSKTRRNNLSGGLAVSRRQNQADMRTHLIHRPARDIFHCSVELGFPP